jgi:hypothetical protein
MRATCAVLSLLVAACAGTVNGPGSDENGDSADLGPYVPPYESCSGNDPSTPPTGTLCLDDPTAPTTDPPLAMLEHTFVTYQGVPAVHLRVVFDPKFVDNTYGTTRVGYTKGHSFGDLLESDNAQIKLLDKQGNLSLEFKQDYISADPSAPCGYSCLGVDGGDGMMLVGDRAAILGWTSSLDRNLNERGYCLTTDSPATDAICTPNAAAPDWDFRVVYEVWIALSAFPNGFGTGYMTFVHASPSKYPVKTVHVEPAECPCIAIDNHQCDDGGGGGGGGEETPNCTTNSDCPTEWFCYNMQCLPPIL